MSEYALAQGHEVSLFHRGKTNSDSFPEGAYLLGDRDGDLSALEGGRCDIKFLSGNYLAWDLFNLCHLLA